ncbi:MAG: ABC transporter substrate-binding protein [Sphaerochaetaceae bacterium]|jgi:branched-chain amino acid transport system substrate-binding protein|nr:ABC transporter substrate-binding protein [Sphaerochaetaceae bacterium]MDX9939273.1 ABC transporter substrate-binding protein [Sphaerochaetaceae bacterium]
MKKVFAAIMIVALVGTMTLFAAGGQEAAPSSVNVGFIGPMTGDYANYGNLISKGALVAIDEKNAAGGIAGKIKINLIIEDSEGEPQKGLAGIEKLSSSDKIVALIGPVFTGVSFAVGQRVQDEGIMMVTPSGTHKDITEIGNYVFRTVASDGLQGDVSGHYFYEALGVRNLAVLYVKNDYSQGLYEGTKASFESRGGKVVIAETAQIGDKDFKTQLTKIRAAAPDAIYIPNYTAEMAQILEQASQLGMKIPFLSSDGFSNPEIYDLAPAYTDGVIYVGPTQVAESAAYKKFVADYTAKWGFAPDSFATNAYDAAYILFDALEKVYAQTGKFDRKAIRDAFAATKDFPGVTGTINFAENGDLVAYQGVYKVDKTTPKYVGTFTVVDGKLVEVK